ncbi:MAG: hypothetical protein JNM93_12785 [Bacteriovoracaceae bacterium]|nr:hypothetical protein [Bacteriovoracaceae bacterium]
MLNLKLFRFILVIAAFSCSKFAWSYPNYIGHGYSSCLTCHYNPFGNGPLNDYGRAISATVISTQFFSSDKKTDEQLSQSSAFFGKTPSNKWFRPSFDYRGLYLIRNFKEEQQDEDFIQMQADANVVFKFGARDQLIFSGTLGYAPTPKGGALESQPKYRTREHYIGWRPVSSFGIYAGLMDKIFGLRIPEHTAYSRSFTNLGMNDQAHGIQLHYTTEKIDVGYNYFIGNLVQEADVRQVGHSGMFEYSFSKTLRLGASVLTSQSEYLKMTMAALHARAGIGKGSSIMFETGYVDRQTFKTGYYNMLQGYLRLSKGLYLINTFEYQKEDTESESELMRVGPGIQFFPSQRVEFRADLFNSRTYSPEYAVEDVWDITAQLHLWF